MYANWKDFVTKRYFFLKLLQKYYVLGVVTPFYAPIAA